jgi:hypothetical protein
VKNNSKSFNWFDVNKNVGIMSDASNNQRINSGRQEMHLNNNFS